MHVRVRPAHESRAILAVASCVTIAIGLAFVFVRAPHPWGWEGFDHYHDLALRLARGEPFPTTDVPWGYAYFLAAVYRIAGDHPWVPLTAQVLLNGLVPPLLYALVRRDLGERIALTSAGLAAVLSFNTVYASTQSSDAVCTVLFLAGLVAFREGLASGRVATFALGGLLAGLASQFRPNLLVFPAVAALGAWVFDRNVRDRLRCLAVYVVMAAAVSAPWIARNVRLTGEFIPTSTHGGVQLWYGSLQTGPYLRSRAYNPRSVFEAAAFDYTSLANRSLIVTASRQACVSGPMDAWLHYWTDRDATVHAMKAPPTNTPTYSWEIPGQPIPTTVYYRFATTSGDTDSIARTPAAAAGPDASFVFFVDDRHLADMDRHADLIDAFDFARVVRTLAWQEPLPSEDRLDLNRDGRITQADLQAVARAMSSAATENGSVESDLVASLDVQAESADVHFVDGSVLSVPRRWSERITDLVPRGNLAQQMCVAHARMPPSNPPPQWSGLPEEPCRRLEGIRVNQAFYRREPHLMRRYTALALDNIRRDPAAFVRACAYRALRLFIVDGSSDSWTTQQFEGSGRVYLAAGIVSASYLLAGIVGLVIALRRRATVWLLLAPIVYVPITISYVLTNMRYTVTIQPPLFAFVAIAVTAALARFQRAPDGAAAEAARSSNR